MSELTFKIPNPLNHGPHFNAPILDVYLDNQPIGSLIQTKRNLPDGASTDRFYLANTQGASINETDSYSLSSCLERIKAYV